MSACVYRRLLGPAFDALPSRVRELHDLDGIAVWIGEADVRRGSSLIARFLALLFGLPPEGPAQSLTVTFTASDDAETWERTFSGRRFVSRQSVRDGLVDEVVGPVTLTMRPIATTGALSLDMIAARFLGLPLPSVLVPQIATREFEADDHYRFQVSATLPLFGLLVAYEGWLEKKT